MPASPSNRLRTHLRQRGTTALVLSRSDANTGSSVTSVGETDPQSADPRRVWPAVLTWILLGAAIAALWALLLLGDSLVVSG